MTQRNMFIVVLDLLYKTLKRFRKSKYEVCTCEILIGFEIIMTHVKFIFKYFICYLACVENTRSECSGLNEDVRVTWFI